MLDLEALISEMHGLATDVVRSAEDTLARRDVAVEQVSAAAQMPGLREAVLKVQQDMALPAPGRELSRTYAVPPVGDYTVIATDGSQVAPDYHHVAPWYVVNVGAAVFRYGAPDGRDRCRLLSRPRLFPPRRDVLPASGDEEAVDARAASLGNFGSLEFDRLEAELRWALELIQTDGDAGRTVLLLDGPLVQWRMVQELRRLPDGGRLIGLFQELLAVAYEHQVAIAGYISRSRAVEWITLLRFSLCEEVAAGRELCPECRTGLLRRYSDPDPSAHHAALAGLRDVQVAERLLAEPYMRTEVLELKSKPWEMLTGGGDAAGFFYLNTGTEIARVEAPQWVWQNDDLTARLHSVLADQCEVGHGYPMVLSEAHEQAVVRGPDRDAFYAIVERVLNDHGLYEAATSAKALSKRCPLA